MSTARPAAGARAAGATCTALHVARRAVESCGLVMAVAWSVIANPVCLNFSFTRTQSYARNRTRPATLLAFAIGLRRAGRQATLTQGGERARAHDPTAYTRVQSTLRPSPPLDPARQDVDVDLEVECLGQLPPGVIVREADTIEGVGKHLAKRGDGEGADEAARADGGRAQVGSMQRDGPLLFRTRLPPPVG